MGLESWKNTFNVPNYAVTGTVDSNNNFYMTGAEPITKAPMYSKEQECAQNCIATLGVQKTTLYMADEIMVHYTLKYGGKAAGKFIPFYNAASLSMDVYDIGSCLANCSDDGECSE